MSRLIDIDDPRNCYIGTDGEYETYNIDPNVIAEASSVQPDIVRCKDCKHSEHWYRDKSRCFLWHEEGIDVFEDGFCSYAERRTDGSD